MKSEDFNKWTKEIRENHKYCDNYYTHLLPLISTCDRLFRMVLEEYGSEIDVTEIDELVKPVDPWGE